MQHEQEKTKVLEQKNSPNATLNITDLTLAGQRSNQSLCSERKAVLGRLLKTDVQLVCVCVCVCVCKSRKMVNRP